MKDVVIKEGRDYSIKRRHPWVFSGAVERAAAGLTLGETVRVIADDGTVLGLGAWSEASQIRVRMWTCDPTEAVDAAFFERRIAAAIQLRADLGVLRGDDNALRLVNAESDGLPGLVVDRYGDFIVCQFTAAGVERWKGEITGVLVRRLPACAGIYERSDATVRDREGLDPVAGVLRGAEPPDQIQISENGCRYGVDVKGGHKTGFYLDQRVNRARVASVAAGREVLNAFAYTGGFGVAAGMADAARVTHVDLSAPALDLARANTALNGIAADRAEFITGDVFQVLRQFRDSRRAFDLIVLDPPKFVESKGQVMAGCRGYKDINLLGMKLLRPGGLLATFSCSGLVTPDLFHKVVADAAVDAGRRVQIIERLQQGPDHPEDVCFPEGLYLKGLLCQVG
ncbi:MAG: 23S rRNA (cytosine(1962)-C(5))-methyltransferase RlmI [Lentisphaerae bacterium]|nr:23S rRNA (cytosine(1962)-C(5))-methyltransferase RlmI [Lentisphaerota bacterium]